MANKARMQEIARQNSGALYLLHKQEQVPEREAPEHLPTAITETIEQHIRVDEVTCDADFSF